MRDRWGMDRLRNGSAGRVGAGVTTTSSSTGLAYHFVVPRIRPSAAQRGAPIHSVGFVAAVTSPSIGLSLISHCLDPADHPELCAALCTPLTHLSLPALPPAPLHTTVTAHYARSGQRATSPEL